MVRLFRGAEASDDDVVADADYLRRACASPNTLSRVPARRSVRSTSGRYCRRSASPHCSSTAPRRCPTRSKARATRHSRSPVRRLLELPGEPIIPAGAGLAGALDETEAFLTEVWNSGGWEEPEPDRVLATILFTDIVDSTERAAELGDRAWHELLGTPSRGGASPARSFPGHRGEHGGRRLLRQLRRAGAGDPLRLLDRRLGTGARARGARRPAHRGVRARRRQGVTASPCTPAHGSPPKPARARYSSRAP